MVSITVFKFYVKKEAVLENSLKAQPELKISGHLMTWSFNVN